MFLHKTSLFLSNACVVVTLRRASEAPLQQLHIENGDMVLAESEYRELGQQGCCFGGLAAVLAIIGGVLYSEGCYPSMPLTCVKYTPQTGTVTALFAAMDGGNYGARCVLENAATGLRCTLPAGQALSASPADALNLAQSMGYAPNSTRTVLHDAQRNICFEQDRSKLTIAGIVLIAVSSFFGSLLVCVFCLCCDWSCKPCSSKPRSTKPSSSTVVVNERV